MPLDLPADAPADRAARAIATCCGEFRGAAGRARHAQATGSSNRVCRAILLAEPPSLDAGEITDKGSINQRAVLRHRAALVDELYADAASTARIVIDERRRTP